MASAQEYAALARNVSLFKGLDAHEVAKIVAHGKTMRAPKGNVIFYEGTVGSQMFVVLGGKVGLYQKDTLLASLTVGDMFGEMALISSEPRSATASAIEDSHIFCLDETTFQRLMTKRVAIQILFNVVGTLSRRLRDANKKLRALEEAAE